MIAITTMLVVALLLIMLLQSMSAETKLSHEHKFLPSWAQYGRTAMVHHTENLANAATHNECLMGYELLSNLFHGGSKLWLVPIARRLILRNDAIKIKRLQ